MNNLKENTLFNEYSSLFSVIVFLFIVPHMIKDLSSKNVNIKQKGEHRVDSVQSINIPCESPAIMRGYENDSIHTTMFSAPGRKISVSIFKKDFEKNTQIFLHDTCCRDSLAYPCNISKLQNDECLRLVSSLYDCNDSLLSKKVIIVYNKNFLYSDIY